jgi:hypothetical protein
VHQKGKECAKWKGRRGIEEEEKEKGEGKNIMKQKVRKKKDGKNDNEIIDLFNNLKGVNMNVDMIDRGERELDLSWLDLV